MTFRTDYVGYAVRHPERVVYAFRVGDHPLRPVKREYRVKSAGDDHELFRSRERQYLTHVEVSENPRNIVAGAVPHSPDRTREGRDRAGRNGSREPLLERRRVNRRRAAAGVAHHVYRSLVDDIRKVRDKRVDTAHDVPDPLAYDGSADEEVSHSRFKALRSVLVPAALAEIPLFEGYRGKAFPHGADTEVAVSVDCFSRIFRAPERDVHTHAVSLKGYYRRERLRGVLRYEKVARDIVAGLALEPEAYLAEFRLFSVVFGDDVTLGGYHVVEPQKLRQPVPRERLPLENRHDAVPAHRGLSVREELFCVFVGCHIYHSFHQALYCIRPLLSSA